jgi:NAD(P)-dependent dehydrogenase (short-subunit alcohol dehydrogenase family)
VRRFEGATAVVTGGGQGIGAAVARALAAEGAAVVVAARRSDRIEQVATEIRATGGGGGGGKAWAVHCDVTDPASVNDLAKAAARHAGAIDILVNNAGVAYSAPLAKTTLEDWNRVLAVNATGTFLCTRAFISGMLERKHGSIVNVASVAGLTGGGARYIAAYAAAKHAVIGLTESVAAEVEGTGVTCNAVCPGFVDTEMTEESIARVVAKTGKDPDAALSAMLASASQRRLITPEEVAEAVLALCDTNGTRPNGAAVTIAE